MCISYESSSDAVASPTLTFIQYATPGQQSEEATRPEGEILKVDVGTALGTPEALLLYSPGLMRKLSSGAETELEGCRNKGCRTRQAVDLIERFGPKFGRFTRVARCVGESVFMKVFKDSFHSGVISCNAPKCSARKASLNAVAPRSAWPAFRDFILTILSCWTPLDELRNIWRHILVDDTGGDLPKSCCLDLRGIYELCRWSWRLAFGRQTPIKSNLWSDKHQTGHELLLQVLGPGYEESAVRSTKRCREYGLCPNRLWNISLQSDIEVADIPIVAEAALKAPPPTSRGKHDDCTDQHCLLATHPSTVVEQAHRCQDARCSAEVVFPPQILNEAFAEAGGIVNSGTWFNTAWKVGEPKAGYWGRFLSFLNFKNAPSLCGDGNHNYMAISHVWADGTGVGKKPSRVNACLFNYFAEIANRLDCDGIWWDAISIPTERNARTAAINAMLGNYEKTKITLVHDEDLVNFPWEEDGSPAVALVLSSWFTRGWTAAELWASRKHTVKVLFGDPQNPNGPPLIKDLDDDILAWDLAGWLDPANAVLTKKRGERILNPTGRLPHLAHFIATDLVRRFRDTDGPLLQNLSNNLSEFLMATRSRTTSWPRDRIISAGLMCSRSTRFDSTMSTPEITRRILAQFDILPITSLVHDEVPICPLGRWDWCPQSLFDLGHHFLYSTSLGSCHVKDNGTMWGNFTGYQVCPNDVIVPCGRHPAQIARVSVALSSRATCLLLTVASLWKRRICILFQPAHMGRSVISGHWVACVFLQSPETLEIISVRKEGEWTLEERRFVEQQSFEFGNNVSENGMPLPALTVESVFTALDGYQRCDYVDEKTRWFLSKGFVQQTHDRSTTQENFEASRAGWPENWNRRKWLLQIAQIHDLDANVMADHPYYEERSSGHPSATMVLQSTPRENQIAKSFLSKIQNFVIMEKKEGVVNLSWSFLGDISRRTRCSSPRRTTFTAAFNIVSKVGAGDGTYDMCLGGESLEQLIKPISGLAMSQLDDHDDVFVYTCDICHECEGCLDDAEICFAGMGPRVQMRVTSVQENE